MRDSRIQKGKWAFVVLLFTLFLTFFVIPAPSFAEDLIEVWTANDLNNVRNNLAGNYIQMADIDLSGYSNWEPIGTYEARFTGKYDGNGHIIRNLHIDRSSTNYVGLFGYMIGDSWRVRNLGLIDVNVSGYAGVGSLAGCADGGGTGQTNGIENCFATGSVTGNNTVGGLVGYNYSSGWTQVTIRNSYSFCTVTGVNRVGGLVGRNYRPSWGFGAFIDRCYATGSVSGTTETGGLVGLSNSTVSYSYYDTQTTGQSDTGKGEPKTTAEMMQQSTYVNWNFTNIWDISPENNNGYPYLRSVEPPVQLPPISGIGAIDSLRIRDQKDILPPTCQGDPVDTASGAMNINKSLLAINGARPLSFDVTYNSLLLNDGSLGKGWGHNFETHLEQLIDGNVKVNWNANRENTFINDGLDNFSAAERAILFDTLVKNTDGTFTLTRQDQSVYQFDTQGKLVEQKNRKGQSLTLSYDTAGLLQTITEPISGRYLSVHNNVYGLIDQVSDPLNRTVSFSYNSENNLTGFTDALGRTTSYTYNSDGRVLTGTDADGRQYIAHTYDSLGRVITQDDGLSDNQLFLFSYDEESQPGKIVTTVTNRMGKIKVLTHNNKYQLESVRDELGNTTSYTYDADGNCNGFTDGNGHTTGFTYDDSGNTLTRTDALGHITTMTYDNRNNLKTVTNNAGKVSTMDYDTNNNLTSVIDFMGNTTSYTYNSNSLMETRTMPRSGIITWTYINGLPETVTDAVGNTMTFDYDAAGRLLSITDPAGKTSYIVLDNDGNINTLIDALNQSISFTYDSRDNKLTQTDARGYTTTFTYDANNNLKTATDPMNNITQYQYDGEDRLFKIIDARGNATTYTRDDKGRVMGITGPLGYTLNHEYDAADNLTGIWDRKGVKISTITYDDVDNQKTLTDALNRTVTYDYDNLNRLSQVTDPSGHIKKYGYDNLDRLTSVIDALSGTGSQTFDADGNRNIMTDPNNNQTVFDYDLAGQLTSETSAAGNTVFTAYNNRNLPEQITNGRGQIISYTYDDAGLIKTSTDPTGTITYNCDENGNVLTVADNSGTITREFDTLNRVKKYTDARGNIIQYSYDEVGNLETLTYPDGRQVAYEYSTEDLLEKVTDWAGYGAPHCQDKFLTDLS